MGMMATKDPQTEAYVAGVCWAAGRVVAAAVEAGIAAGNLSPAARGMAPGDIATQYDEYAGERCGFEMLCESVKDESIPGEPLSGEWADEPTDQSLSDMLDPEGTLMPGVVGDAWLAGVDDVMVGTWSALVAEDQVREYVARQDDEH